MALLFPSYQLLWGTTGQFNYSLTTTATPSDDIVVDRYDQIGLLVNVEVRNAVLIQVLWKAENGPVGYECVESPAGVNPANGFQQFTLTPKEFGPMNSGYYSIWLPCAAWAMRLFVYSNETVVSGNFVQIGILLRKDYSERGGAA